MVSQALTALLSLSGPWAYLAVGLLAFGESAAFIGLVLPGETALVFGGVLAGHGTVGLPQMMTVAAVAAILGDSFGYQLGMTFGPPLRISRPGTWIGETRWTKAERYLERRGGAAVFWGRWVGLLRALVPTLAGMGRLPYRTFLPWNVAGGISWAGTMVGLGYIFAGSVDAIVRVVAGAGSLMTALLLTALLVAVVRRGLRSGLVRGWLAVNGRRLSAMGVLVTATTAGIILAT